MPTKNEREVVIPEAHVWTKIRVKNLKLMVRGEPQGQEFEIVRVLEADIADGVETGVRIKPSEDTINFDHDESIWDLQDDIRSIEGWDDEEDEDEE